MVHSEIQLISSFGQDIFGNAWKVDKGQEAKANIVIIHGMAEYSYRYNDFATFLVSNGFDVYGVDHLGHGLGVSRRKNPMYNYGDWPEGGFQNSVDQVYELVKFIKSFSNKPIFIFGHSLGSFIATAFYEQHSDAIDGEIICGSAYNNMTYRSSRLLTMVMKPFISKAKRKLPKKVLINASNSAMNKKSAPFEDKYQTVNGWLSYNEDNIKRYDADKECGFPCSFMFFYEMFKGQQKTWKKSSLKDIKTPKDLFVIAGADDPVGGYGKDVKKLYNFLKTKQDNVQLKLYPHMKHEVLNETDHKVVYDDVLNFYLNELKKK